VASPSTYLLNMQNTAAIKTVSWISTPGQSIPVQTAPATPDQPNCVLPQRTPAHQLACSANRGNRLLAPACLQVFVYKLDGRGAFAYR
jgi:hypothetical protein